MKKTEVVPVRPIRYKDTAPGSSGTLLDRIDIHIEVPKVDFKTLSAGKTGELSTTICQRVNQARTRQQERYDGG